MAFQLNEKMLAHDRALITRNLTEADLKKSTHDAHLKFKPGMLHYVSDTKKLFLSIDPTPIQGETKSFLELLTVERLGEAMTEFVHRDGGLENSIHGQLHLTVSDKAPFVINNSIKVDKLNADLVDGKHVDDSKTGTSYLWTADKITNEFTNAYNNSTTITLQAEAPTNITNKDAYWYEIVAKVN